MNKFCTDIYVPQRMNPKDAAELLTFSAFPTFSEKWHWEETHLDIKGIDLYHLKLSNWEYRRTLAALVPHGDISVHGATTTDVNTSSGIFQKRNLLKWTLIMSESAPLKDNVHNFQKGHNGKHLIRWSLMRLHQQHLMASAIQPEPLRAKWKAQIPLSGSSSVQSHSGAK